MRLHTELQHIRVRVRVRVRVRARVRVRVKVKVRVSHVGIGEKLTRASWPRVAFM